MDLADNRRDIRGETIGRSRIRCVALLGGSGELGAAKLDTTRFGRRQRRRGPLRDHRAFVLGDGCENVKCQPGGVRIVDRDKLHARSPSWWR